MDDQIETESRPSVDEREKRKLGFTKSFKQIGEGELTLSDSTGSNSDNSRRPSLPTPGIDEVLQKLLPDYDNINEKRREQLIRALTLLQTAAVKDAQRKLAKAQQEDAQHVADSRIMQEKLRKAMEFARSMSAKKNDGVFEQAIIERTAAIQKRHDMVLEQMQSLVDAIESQDLKKINSAAADARSVMVDVQTKHSVDDSDQFLESLRTIQQTTPTQAPGISKNAAHKLAAAQAKIEALQIELEHQKRKTKFFRVELENAEDDARTMIDLVRRQNSQSQAHTARITNKLAAAKTRLTSQPKTDEELVSSSPPASPSQPSTAPASSSSPPTKPEQDHSEAELNRTSNKSTSRKEEDDSIDLDDLLPPTPSKHATTRTRQTPPSDRTEKRKSSLKTSETASDIDSLMNEMDTLMK